MDCLIHLTYFPSISHFVAMIHANKVHIEVCDNYQKQTYRNRTEIYSANGKLVLTVPVIYSQTNRQRYRDVKIANTGNWQQNQLKSLQAAYSMSPFFEFYIDDFISLFENKFTFLIDFNFECLERLKNALQLQLNFECTNQYVKKPMDVTDLRYLVQKKQQSLQLKPYAQVFSNKHGFIPDLSILDLLFNEGPASEVYLSQQELS